MLRGPCDEASARSASARAPCRQADERWVLAATILASSLVFVDGTVVNVALPQLQRAFDSTIFESQWVVESYALFLSTLLLLGGVAGDRYGRRCVFSIGVAVFAAASAWCAGARGIEELILARGLQGCGGALLVPTSLAILGASFPEARRGRAIGIWSGYTAVAAALGPVAGGGLVDHYSWRWAFLLNLPFAGLAIAIAQWKLAESRDDSASALDWLGAALATCGVGALVFGLIESAPLGWSAGLVVAAFVASAILLVAFGVQESRTRAPMLPIDMFRNRTFAGANLLTFFLYAALSGALFFLPQALIEVHHYPAAGAGAALLPLVVLMFALSRRAGDLVDRYGARLPLVAGPAIAAVGFALFALPGTDGSYWTTFFPAVVVLGFGMTVCVAPLTTTVMSAADVGHAGTASGINNAVSRVGGLLAIALLGLVMNAAFDAKLARGLDELLLTPEVAGALTAERGKLGAIKAPANLDAKSKAAIEDAVAASFVAGFRAVMLISALLALVGAVAALLLVEPDVHRRRKSTSR